MKLILDYRMHADLFEKLFRVYRSNGMSNNRAFTIYLFIVGAAFQVGIRVVFSMSLWICGAVELRM